MNKMINISEVSDLTGVTIQTLKIEDNEKKLSCVYKYPNRLARFGYNYLIEYAKTQNVVIEPVEHVKRLEPNEEMVQDLISVVTCFSARLYGARGGKKIKNTINALEKERGETLEDNNKSNIN